MSSIDDLIGVLQANGVSTETKIEAIKSVGYSKNKRALDYLVKLLDDESADVRGAVIWAIGKYKNEDFLPKIVPKIKDPDDQVRTVALKTLAKFNSNPEILGEILRLLDDDDPSIRKMVLEATVEFEAGNPSINILEKIIERLKNDKEKDVRLKAIELIGDRLFRNDGAASCLIECLETTEDFELQMAIIDQLSKIDPYIKEFLMLSLKGRKKLFIEVSADETQMDLIYRRNSPLVMKVRGFKEEIEVLKRYVAFLSEKHHLISS
nr:HEAT repeat domain-containing protein [Candidatus Sigynarchaeota archaeon]